MAIAIAIAILSVNFVLLYIGYITETTLFIDSVGFTLGIILIAIALEERKRTAYEPSKLMVRYHISYILVGAIAGMAICFFAVPLLAIGVVVLLRSFGYLLGLFSFEWLLVTGMIIGVVMGSIWGHFLFKRSKYAKITYYDPFA
ncbi:MAG: hypothetical protein ABSC20_06125 [Candidatus Bathyarchaeia archaeon]